MEGQKFNMEIGSSPLTVELTPLAGQSNGRVIVRQGETTVLVTAVMSTHPREGGDFFPLMVDYEEKFYAAGKILGSRFVKRESRPSEEAILTSRLIDRTIRPRFDLRMRNDVHVVATVLALDDRNDADLAAILGASLALALSDIPWDGPVAAVRIGRRENAWFINPSFEERKGAELDLVVSGTAEKINMIEAGAREVPEAVIAEALERGQAEIKKLIAFEEKVIAAARPTKAQVKLFEISGAARGALVKNFSGRIEEALWTKEKTLRNQKLAALREEWLALVQAEFPETSPGEPDYLWEDELDVIVHRRIIALGERPDGRKPNELRPLRAEAGVLPRVHGSGLFVRGETEALSALTLGGPGDEQIIEGMEIRGKRRFMHHYNFPPYATGEIKPMRGPGRREIGHGALAERALAPLIPPKETFPYTIRIVSEILSSNGSSSMASVCGATLALFDAGVPMQKPVAGAAMGLMMDGERYRILTDIQGPEDHYGDMDFKAAGTADGITALQMDVKIDGVTVAMLAETLTQAKIARQEILKVMTNTMPAPRPELSPNAPRIEVLKIDPEKIGALIGPGGKMINSIIAATDVDIDVEDDGTVFVISEKAAAMQEALRLIRQATHEYKPGELLEGTVSRIFGFGAMVEVAPKTEGLVHISELAPWHVNAVEDIVQVGDHIPVMVRDIDEQGRLNLSLKSVPGRYSAEDIERAEAAGTMGRPAPGAVMRRAGPGARPDHGRDGRAFGRGGPRRERRF
ncbi:MAG: polyribonucleotide nucleotidyltransferase [Candidatus Sungbacteria bacterium]|uniref:Polyribonucleotide nucleotidyltransferase n=1 Tax=Candidatus Sungiibacteriota bacterium TaxID=2750080 RepID=A0A932YXS3_9BACT|nr:polyribonucleotide nucleotidyltransferase [Candidatus Sungbacteria bacterium]